MALSRELNASKWHPGGVGELIQALESEKWKLLKLVSCALGDAVSKSMLKTSLVGGAGSGPPELMGG